MVLSIRCSRFRERVQSCQECGAASCVANGASGLFSACPAISADKLDTSNTFPYILRQTFISSFSCQEVDFVALQNGDLVLRRGRDDWPNFIPRPMDYTHAGIGVARAGADAVVDACPIVGDRLHVVDHVDVDEFLGATLAPGGGAVYRLHPRVGKPKSKGAAAANWAAARVGRSHEFNLFASLNPEAVDQVGHASMPVYCSQFVYCAYSIGAQLELVLP